MITRLSRFLQRLYGDKPPEERTAEDAMWQMIETSLLTQRDDWKFVKFGHVLYNEKADFGIWTSNEDYGLTAGEGQDISPPRLGRGQSPPDKWRKRLWNAAKSYVEEEALREKLVLYDKIATAFEKTVN